MANCVAMIYDGNLAPWSAPQLWGGRGAGHMCRHNNKHRDNCGYSDSNIHWHPSGVDCDTLFVINIVLYYWRLLRHCVCANPRSWMVAVEGTSWLTRHSPVIWIDKALFSFLFIYCKNISYLLLPCGMIVWQKEEPRIYWLVDGRLNW